MSVYSLILKDNEEVLESGICYGEFCAQQVQLLRM